MVKIIEVLSKSDKKRFFKFPNTLYKDCPLYVPVLTSDEMGTFDPSKNGAYQYAESRLWLAERDGEVVGRIGAILNHAANKKEGTRMLRFTRFDFIDDFEVSEALFKTAVDWAKELGMTQLTGPLGFSNLDKQGMLVDGFDQMDMYITLYNYPYYMTHMDRLGLVKRWDWVEMKMNVPDETPDKVNRVASIAESRFGYHVQPFKSMNEVKPYIKGAMDIINTAFAKLHGVVPLSQKQMDNMSHLIMLVGKPEYCLMVANEANELVGFGFLAPSISRGIRSGKGGMGLFTILNILRDLRDHRHIDFYMIGVRPEDQNHGVEALILRDGIMHLKKHGAIDCQTGPMLEDNHVVQNSWKQFDAWIHRRRRCYVYDI
ncbi:MAG: hypothetical protein MJY79_02480 [Bacteroidaceae bacterium]|nr:hypothetical protein [Bacteroidaceae bacterium]